MITSVQKEDPGVRTKIDFESTWLLYGQVAAQRLYQPGRLGLLCKEKKKHKIQLWPGKHPEFPK